MVSVLKFKPANIIFKPFKIAKTIYVDFIFHDVYLKIKNWVYTFTVASKDALAIKLFGSDSKATTGPLWSNLNTKKIKIILSFRSV